MTKDEYKNVHDLQQILTARRAIMAMTTDNDNTAAYRSAFIKLCTDLEKGLGVQINMEVEDSDQVYFVR